MKIIEIEDCESCPSHHVMLNTGKRVCLRMHWKKLDKCPFPDWCPLENVVVCGHTECIELHGHPAVLECKKCGTLLKAIENQQDMPPEFNKVVDKMIEEG